MQVVILAGGLATRLRPLTANIPKSMVRIKGKPFLEYQLELLRSNGLSDIVLCVGYLSDQIKEYFRDGKDFEVKIEYSEEKELLDTGGALKNAEELLEEKFFVMYGDSYLPFDYNGAARYFEKFNKKGLMVVYKNYNKYDKSNVVIKNNLVVEYDKKKQSRNMIYIDYGVSILRKKVLDGYPKGKAFSLEMLFKKLILEKELLAFETKIPFYEIGSFEGLRRFEKFVASIEHHIPKISS